MATNGTVQLGRGGAAYTIHTWDKPGTLRSVLPVDRCKRHTTLYWAELCGILGTLLAIHQLLCSKPRVWDHLTRTLWCDKIAAVRKFKEIEGLRPFSVGEANDIDADIIQEIRTVKNKLPITIEAEWVRSHQEKLDTREAA